MAAATNVDILFVLDATQSTQPIFNSMVDYVSDILFDIKLKFRKANFNYGAVIYRDPVSYKDTTGGAIDAEMQREIDQIIANDKLKRDAKLRQYGVDPAEVDEEIAERKKHFNREHFPFNQNVTIQMDSNMENFISKLMEVECGSGNDIPEDWAGAMELAVNEIKWRQNSKKQIIWISDDDAHGEYFCGFDDKHNDQVEKLLQLTQRVAEMGIYFTGINIVRETDNGCQRTLERLKDKYEECGGKSFLIEEYKLSKDNYIDDEYWPVDVMKGFINTINITIIRRGGVLDDSFI